MFDFPNSPTTGQSVSMPDGSARIWDGTKWQAGTGAGAAAAFLPLTGGTLTGLLTLAADPTADLQAATKQYVDNGAFLPLAGGSVTGHTYMATAPAIPTDVGYAAMLSAYELVLDGAAAAHIAWNSYITNVPNWKYRATGYAAQEWMDSSGNWNLALFASGTAGNVLGAATGTLQLTQSGQLTCGGKGQFTPAIIAVASANPCVTCWNTGGSVAMGMWCQGGYLYLGNTDGGGVPSNVRASLDQSGNFNATGNVSAVNVSASGQVTATGNIVTNANFVPGATAASSQTYFGADGSTGLLNWQANYAIQYLRSSGTVRWLSGGASGGIAMTLDNTGTLALTNALSVSQASYANRNICKTNCYLSYNAASDFIAFADGQTNFLQYQNGWSMYFDRPSGSVIQQFSGAVWFYMVAGSGVIYNNRAPMGGVGAYQVYSDMRGKSAITNCDRGMDVIRDLRPVKFVRKPMKDLPPRRTEIGFIAQDVQEVLPEAVVPMGVELEDGTGKLDDAEPTLGLMTDPIIAVMVNALKEMEHVVRDLSARLVQLEAPSA